VVRDAVRETKCIETDSRAVKKVVRDAVREIKCIETDSRSVKKW
jgi:hypothetical protein